MFGLGKKKKSDNIPEDQEKLHDTSNESQENESPENDRLEDKTDEKSNVSEQESIELQKEEIVQMDAKKRRFMYMAVDKDGGVLLNSGNDPYFVTVEEGKNPSWPKDIQGIACMDDSLRVEVKEVDEKISNNKKRRDKADKEIKGKAQDALRSMAKDRIKEAIERKQGKKTSSEKSVEDHIPDTKVDEKIKEESRVTTGDEKQITSGNTDNVDNTDNADSTDSADSVDSTNKADNTSVIDAINSAESRINADLSDSTVDIIEAIGASLKEQADAVKDHVEKETQLIDGNVKKYVEDSVRLMSDRTRKSTESIVGKINDSAKTLTEGQGKIVSKATAIDKHVTDLSESVESIEGNLRRLDQLDEVVKVLQDKGLVMSMDIPPINADEEDIINLVRYSQRITEQLGYAARDLIRKQAAFKSQEQNNANEQNMMEKKLKQAHEVGVREGKKLFIKQLISKYSDVDTIRCSEDGYVHAIWAFIEEMGAVIDGDGRYEKGKEVTINSDEAEKMMAVYTGIKGEGTYRVIHTGLVYAGEVVYKAEFEKTGNEGMCPDESDQAPTV